MKRAAAYAVCCYLTLGILLGLSEQPAQVWFCADPDAPHDGTWGNVRRSDACEATVTLQERALFFALATVLWLPVVVLKALTG